jgi:hypothetical protein
MKKIDWNVASELGLIRKINRYILHPLGLAMSRNPDNGHSECILVADDGIFNYKYDNGIFNYKYDKEDKSIEEIKYYLDCLK